MTVKKEYVAFVMPWEESERGWGCRPDGYSLHATKDDTKAFIDAHWARYKEMYGDVTPYEYSRPAAREPRLTAITSEAAKRLRRAVKAGKQGVWFNRRTEFEAGSEK